VLTSNRTGIHDSLTFSLQVTSFFRGIVLGQPIVYGHTKHCDRNYLHQINKIIEQLRSPACVMRDDMRADS
jgi:hypothetical protein